MVDACHIVPFSEGYDDTITNGIALCPNLHRAFDSGLIGIDSEYRVMIVSKTFGEVDNDYAITRFEGKEILIPQEKRYWPDLKKLAWHHENILNEMLTLVI